MTERIIAKKEGPVGWLVFNNPERRNAVSVDMWEAIPTVLSQYESDPEVRVIVLAGAGDKAFVSGADISQFEKQRSGPEAVQRYEELAEGAAAKLQNCDKPVVGMIRGYCLGAGMNIAVLCDIRIASDDARFGIPAARMGLGYRASSMKNLVEIVGLSRMLSEQIIPVAPNGHLVDAALGIRLPVHSVHGRDIQAAIKLSSSFSGIHTAATFSHFDPSL